MFFRGFRGYFEANSGGAVADEQYLFHCCDPPGKTTICLAPQGLFGFCLFSESSFYVAYRGILFYEFVVNEAPLLLALLQTADAHFFCPFSCFHDPVKLLAAVERALIDTAIVSHRDSYIQSFVIFSPNSYGRNSDHGRSVQIFLEQFPLDHDPVAAFQQEVGIQIVIYDLAHFVVLSLSVHRYKPPK